MSPVRFLEEQWFLLAGGQREQLLFQLESRLVLRPHKIQPRQTRQYREELWRLSHVLAQLPCSDIGVFHFHRGEALSGH
jgi:hypothetical protein